MAVLLEGRILNRAEKHVCKLTANFRRQRHAAMVALSPQARLYQPSNRLFLHGPYKVKLDISGRKRRHSGRRMLCDPLAAITKGADIISSNRLHLDEASKVCCLGPAAVQLLPVLQGIGVRDITLLSHDSNTGEHPLSGAVGGESGMHVVNSILQTLPHEQGPYDAVIWSSGLDTSASAREHLLAACLRLKPGGRLCGLELGDAQHSQHHLDAGLIKELMCDLPLRGQAFVENSHFILQVTPGYKLRQGPVLLEGDVTTGFGRGSRQMGTPTANLPPQPLKERLAGLPLGVYFGWARLDAGSGQPSDDSATQGMVMNIGRNPTVQDAGAITVELHILHKYAGDFYGRHLKAVVLGFIRPEVKFGSLPDLIQQIARDKATARNQLQTDMHLEQRQHPHLEAKHDLAEVSA